MEPSRFHSDNLRRRVIVLFFLGLLLMAALTLLIGWLSAGWGRFDWGWWNPAIGSILTLLGVALVVWSVRVQYVIGRGTPAPKVATQALVTKGPYAHTRNPMTLGALMLYLGIGIWMGSGLVVFLTIIIFSGLLSYIYIHETAELAERFGSAYLDYRKRTPFLLPRFRNPQ